ncbi:MAG: hypothetical protein HYX68_13900 [Planctomycetes bacterium]|nr:hypothetical protein [Planctomycetota bacterium]
MTDSEFHRYSLDQWGTDGGPVPDDPEDATQEVRDDNFPEISAATVVQREVVCPS